MLALAVASVVASVLTYWLLKAWNIHVFIQRPMTSARNVRRARW